MSKMAPEAIMRPRNVEYTIEHLLHHVDFERKSRHDPDSNWLFDTIIPPFQRPIVWDEGMMSRFITSAWRNLDIGRYVVNHGSDFPEHEDKDGNMLCHPTHRWLIDGQQRLTAILHYVHDGFTVMGRDGLPHLWSELTEGDRTRFGDIGFSRGIVSLSTEYDLRVLYDSMNYGGVAHTDEQRALPEGIPDDWTPSSIR